ncbi:group 1 glycosyl transferase [Neobacillus bataviensis LMG 21833]|uniref:Group 1 glycosyl transferase n=1 Tax=Neobacillus bataviensis LMG 21833 TaxID=1117379 RepID=K6E7W2_9BACI|nr:glycosyltransferase [Neobacillus bataviensis]EKN69401.1 group 1 glycosyl transferase [Neobacillus bataviensis LMG 21833]
MKKQLLFITQYLHTGGIEKSLLTLLSELDYDHYDVDLLLFDYSGVLFQLVPPEVNILPPLFETFSTPLLQAAPELLKNGKYGLLIGKVLAASLSKFSSGVGTGARWSVYRNILKKQPKHYDAAISYIDFFCNYYVIEKVSAKRKIVYNHMDYAYSQKAGWPCPKLERKSFSKCDSIVTVAESAKESLESYFPEFSNKMHVIHNRVSSDTVLSLSNDTTVLKGLEQTNEIKIVTVARLVDEKGVFFALEACNILIEEGFEISWYLIGNGPLYEALKKKTKEIGIERNFILLGEQANPYPFMSLGDIYVQPSKTEAHCVAVEEAIALKKPIVVTDIPSFNHQIQNEKTGIIVKPNATGIAEGIKRLIRSSELRELLTNNLLTTSDRHKEQLMKLYSLIEG